MAIKGLAQAMKNLDAIDRRAVPRAAATTLNRVAESIIAKTASSVARELAVPRRLIRERIRLQRASADRVKYCSIRQIKPLGRIIRAGMTSG